MAKLWLIAMYEYRKTVFAKSFLIALFSVPLIIGLNITLVLVLEALNTNTMPVGYIDHVGVLGDELVMPYVKQERKAVEFIAFSSEEAADAALTEGEIQAYYVIAEDYFSTRHVEERYLKKPGENAQGQFLDMMQVNLLAGEPPEIAHRISSGSSVRLRQSDGSREFPAGGPTLGSVLPPIIALMLVFLVMMSSGYLMSAVVEEKENRTMEVIATSVSSRQLIVGKVLGIVAISFTQLAVWVLVGVVGIIVAGTVADMPWFQNPELEWATMGAIALLAVPAYTLSSSVMIAIGASVGKVQEGQSVAGLSTILYMLPIYLLVVLTDKPSGMLSLILSFAPFTSLLAFGLRSLVISVPVWQFLVAVVLQSVYAAAGLWLAVKAYQLGMLRYGQRIRLKALFARDNNHAPTASVGSKAR